MSEPPTVRFDGAPRLGGMFGHYRIESIIGRGGMGIVFRATDMRLDRVVALKLVAPELVDGPATSERFTREARLAAAVEHAHIVPVYEAGSVDGILYIAMRAIAGQDLGKILHREAPLGQGRTLDIGEQVGEALDAAHRHGLVHRDVKPANVLLEDRDGDWAWLTDFGLTRQAGEMSSASSFGLAGTIEYMAPEAIEHGTMDGRSDQYSLACVLVHCLAGAPPFDGGTEARVLHAHLHDEPPPLAGRVAGLSSGHDAVLRRALAKRPEDRFPDCRSFLAALRAETDRVTAATAPAASSGPATASGPTAARARRRAIRPVRRRYLVGVMTLAGIVVASTWLFSGAGREAWFFAAQPTEPPASVAPTALESQGDSLASEDGVIVFAGDGGGNYDIWSVLPDGSGLTQLTRAPTTERMPDVSPDGSTVVFAAGSGGKRDLYRINADGSGRERLTSWGGDDYAPAFSPDGRSIAYTSDRSGRDDIWVMTDDGSGFQEATAVNLNTPPDPKTYHLDQYPSWFPDGRHIAFSSDRAESADIWVADALGKQAPRSLTVADLISDQTPSVGPDGSVVFVHGAPDGDLYVIGGAGERARPLTAGSGQDATPDHSPSGTELVFARSGAHPDRTSLDTRLVVTTSDGKQPRFIPLKMSNAVDPAWVARLGLLP